MGTARTLLFIPGIFGIRVPPIVTIASLSPLPGEKRWHALVPGAAYRRAKKKGEGWLISVTFIGVVLIAGLLAGTCILECPASPLTASLSRFLPPCRIMFQDVIGSIALILRRRLSARPARSSDERTCHRGSYGPFRFRAPP